MLREGTKSQPCVKAVQAVRSVQAVQDEQAIQVVQPQSRTFILHHKCSTRIKSFGIILFEVQYRQVKRYNPAHVKLSKVKYVTSDCFCHQSNFKTSICLIFGQI